MVERSIVSKNPASGWRVDKHDDDDFWTVMRNDSSVLYLALLRENNRGWTFESYDLGSTRLEIFYSRGDYKMVPEDYKENE